ncbi:LOW QUALITY PROTEIN: T-cell surface glycoprotein CD3 zeta chain [Cuculus canorus]|uniref:LOW QUALITY PROTEIN: T-cell surface glycoprotein CD3 zeta chain n=1 Tax=Cuculus canorus TaxID=55661 RepID=UPI0023AB1181|nr:LOW QUALITY PROTEIN: T-cell surface glycoprotein CD3 zeta chain [Cuculus canorus]
MWCAHIKRHLRFMNGGEEGNDTKGNPKHQYQECKPQPAKEGACFGAAASRWTPKALIGGELPVELADEQSPWRCLFSAPVDSLPITARASKMKWRRIVIFAILQAQLPVADAVPILGLTDPRLCYLLDGFLFIYAIVITALFVKAKLSQTSELQLQPGQDDLYNKLSRGQRDEYDVLGAKRGADPELGGRHQQRRRNPQDTVYTSLQKDKMGEAYSEIGMKGEQQRRRGKGNEGVYQGLSTATKDTYDALQMQPLPPR